ncbi:MAG: hypothetical protein NTU98_08985 [Bacteroidetes bacterium]|nr:hypothetical protein [Bacteroidota bacterium]
MKKSLFLALFALIVLACLQVDGQKVNGKPFSFPNGKTEWSDTVYKKLLTKQMAKNGLSPVVLGIRYKFVNAANEGNWYEIEITNTSPETKVKFKVSSNHNQDNYTIRLDPKQTKVIDKLYWHSKSMLTQEANNNEGEYINPLFDEILEERY